MLAQVCARCFCFFPLPPPPHTTTPPLLLCHLQREHKAIVFKIVFAAFDSNDGLVMFAVEQCVWQRPGKALPLDRPRNVAKFEHTECSEMGFFVNDWKTFCHAYERTLPRSIGLPCCTTCSVSITGKMGTESSWLKGLWLLVAFERQNFSISPL